MKPRLKVLTLGVDDLERALAFYRDGLGLPTPGIVGTEFEHGAVAFFEFDEKGAYVRSFGDKTILDGDLDRKIHNCRSSGETSWVVVRGIGKVDWAEMPQVVIHTPRDVRVDAGGAVFGTVGRSASLNLDNAGCGDWTIANVEGTAKVSQAGSGDTRMGGASGLKIRVAGSGDVSTADIRGPVDINIAGSGDAAIRSVSGSLEVSIAGSGDVMIGGGRATDMKVSVAGSGDVDFKGVADNLPARIQRGGNHGRIRLEPRKHFDLVRPEHEPAMSVAGRGKGADDVTHIVDVFS